MPASVASRSSLFGRTDIFANLPPGTYHTSDDNTDDDVMALDEAPEHLKKFTNKDAPIVIDSSSDEEDIPPRPNRPGPSKQKRIHRDSDEDEEEYIPPRSQRGTRSSPRKRTKSSTVPRFQQTPAAINSSLPLSSSPAPGPSTPRSYLAEDHLNHVLEILPDIDTEWALGHINQEMILRKDENPANRVVEIALEMEGGYPTFKASKKGKEKEKSPDTPGGTEKYRSTAYKIDDRGGIGYYQNAVSQLEDDFPSIPAPYVRNTFNVMQNLYVPTYFRLLEHSQLNMKPYMELKRPRNSGKGKSKAKDARHDEETEEGIQDVGSAEFKKEMKWLKKTLAKEQHDKDASEAKRIADEEALAGGAGIECGCCFTDTLMAEMVQCAEGHLFCRECASTHAETKLGEQSTSILCMDQSDCTSAFPESELRRCLSEKSLQLYHRLKQAKELEQAEIEGLESCPSCPYAAVIDNPDEKLFRCMNEECGQVTCRGCGKKEHIPRTCAEVEADVKLNHKHTVEDAMSEALIRKCPKCAKPYIKDSGCNKIHCSKCGTLSCYVCQKAINGYEHFDQDPAAYGKPRQTDKCILWDREEKQHDDQAVRAARDAATARVLAAAQENGVALNAEDVNVALPDSQGPMNGGVGGVYMARHIAQAGLGPRIMGVHDKAQQLIGAQAAARDAMARFQAQNNPPGGVQNRQDPDPVFQLGRHMLPPYRIPPLRPYADPNINLNLPLPLPDPLHQFNMGQGGIERIIAPIPRRWLEQPPPIPPIPPIPPAGERDDDLDFLNSDQDDDGAQMEEELLWDPEVEDELVEDELVEEELRALAQNALRGKRKRARRNQDPPNVEG
ncbi:hypothetical protein I302_101834 [Kwoniella bestiolae CBS 10118]|uniref:E3 ubiquitin-protein ligase RNF216 n=1 Tax=Kwoniella bestiolae CBS 10118 TaxID=1296100 RepID=A0A1B9GDD3_9TREE|nr:E3 ubiquitin-protein ligase RNF216 [Kwoniella bestiolae CBS 10118]OCF29021.1 E3 ubiquitin-protein ligase RNF216 [Kwoniella bestiolae CBS 10118]